MVMKCEKDISWHHIQIIYVCLRCFKLNCCWDFDPLGFRGVCPLWLPWGDLALALILSRRFCIVGKHGPEPHRWKQDPTPLCYSLFTALLLFCCLGRLEAMKQHQDGIQKGDLLRPISAWAICHSLRLSRQLSLLLIYLTDPWKSYEFPIWRYDSQKSASVCH